MSLSSLRPLLKYAGHPFPDDYPADDHVTLYAPDDDLPAALAFLIDSAEHSIVLGMYGLDDEAVVGKLLRKMKDECVYVQAALDSSQAGGVHERAILAHAHLPGNSVAIGQSRRHAISHMKQIVIDNLIVIGGSTNLSGSGETRQNNEFTVVRHMVVAARARWKLDLTFAEMRAQMEAKAA